jgi:hypothetical protein
MDNDQNHDSYINIPSSQTYRSLTGDLFVGIKSPSATSSSFSFLFLERSIFIFRPSNIFQHIVIESHDFVIVINEEQIPAVRNRASYLVLFAKYI